MSHDNIMLCFCFGHMTMPIGFIFVDLLIRSSFSWTPQISKSFKLSNFLSPQSHGQIAWVVETERHFFLRKQIIILLPDVYIKLDTGVHTKSYYFSLMPSRILLFNDCLLHRTSSDAIMTRETDQASLVIDDTAASSSKATTSVESDTTSTSSSSNTAT
jgi:hypothetical protein